MSIRGGSLTCSCGKGKYPEAPCCQDCWDKSYYPDDGRISGHSQSNSYASKTRCQCGNPKYSDADCCEECWNRGSAYGDR